VVVRHSKSRSADGENGSKTDSYWGSIHTIEQVSSTPMNGLSEMTLAPFKIWLCATEDGSERRGPYPASLAHVG